MSIRIGNYVFEGPYTSAAIFSDNSGVYAILDYHNEKYRVIDVGESANVKTRLNNHDRSASWTNNCSGTLFYSVHYTPNKQQAGRKEVEQELRQLYNPPCGDR